MKIDIRLGKNFTTQMNKLLAEFGEEGARMNGFSDSQLSYTDFIDNFIDKQDAGIDENANVDTKDICSLTTEMSKPHSKLLAFHKIYHELNKKYGFKVANDWLRNEWDGHFYLHDAASSTFVPYCFAYDLEGLVTRGLFFIEGFNHQPPKHLVTFTDFVGEFVSWTSNRSSGACGLPSFLIYSYYFWKKDVEAEYTNNPEVYRDQEFQRIIYKLNQPYLRVNQSAFSNFSIFDKSYLEALFGGKEFPDGSFIIDHIDEIVEYQKAFMNVVSEVREQNVMTFPVLTFALLRKDGVFVNEEFARWASDHNMKWADSNFFISEDVTSLSNCCRLVSDVKDLGYFNSIGGTALEVGSIKVNTINLARLAYENDTWGGYLSALREKALLAMQTLDVIRDIISRNIDKGLLPNYTYGIMNLESQYNTIGIIGVYEALQAYHLTEIDVFGNTFYTDEGLRFATEIFKTLNEAKDEFAAETNYSINVEEIPAERAASVLMMKDKFVYPNQAYELPLYGNQWIPLGVKTTLQEKIRLSALLDHACNGGSIAHINLDAPLVDSDTAWKLLNYVADEGVVYFAFCTRISACEHNHGFYGTTCPNCGEPAITSYQRIVGFLTKESSYSADRKAEFNMRDWLTIDRMAEI
jgi:ribonucleoside-triphosphate reductase (formate)